MTPRAVTLAGLALSLLVASPAAAAPTEYFGVSQARELDRQDLQAMAAARVQTDRFLLQWRRVQPRPGALNWTQPDRIVGGLAAHGIRPVPFAWGCPEWVCPGPSRAPVGSGFAQEAWRSFLEAAVARYGPGGGYWETGYPEQHGAGAEPLPIESWQVWNEPNLKKYFDPGRTTGHGIYRYARLLEIAHNAIKSQDPQARIVLAGMLGNGDPWARDFLKGLYKVPGFKGSFEVAALHPYSGYLDVFRWQILQFRRVMADHGDGATPLWITELGWGSAPPDRFGINKGLAGQARLLSRSVRMILNNRSAWNVQRLFWYHWRDPQVAQGSGCSFCASAGLFNYDRTPKPAYEAFAGFSSDTTPPQASITAGPGHGGFTKDSTPSFSFTSNEGGSVFVCRVDGGPPRSCRSPFTAPRLSDGAHAFYVRAIDAAGNESRLDGEPLASSAGLPWRDFTVDTTAPAVTIKGRGKTWRRETASASFTVIVSERADLRCRVDSRPFVPCSTRYGTPRLRPGTHTLKVKAIDRVGNVGTKRERFKIARR